MELRDKIFLITGASSGIGYALAVELAKEQCRLALVARRIELLEDLKKKLQITNDRLLFLRCDVTKKDEVKSAYELIKHKFGRIDVAILNAGVGYHVTPKNYNSEYAEDTFSVNFFGIVYWIEQLLPDFLSRKEGTVVGVSSLADNRGYSGSGFYCASKAAVTNYLEGLRVELKPHEIKVITVKPGFVKTPMTAQNKFKMPMLMAPEKAARIIVDGIKKEKRIIQFPAPMVWLTRIVGLLPGRIYEWLAVTFKIN